MKGVAGGPLLCIGDLLSDLEEVNQQQQDQSIHKQNDCKESVSPSILDSDFNLPKLFQDNYSQLNNALSGTDHSWTALTLKLCNSLETANELIRSTNSNVTLLSERVQQLEKIVKRGDSAVSAAKAVHVSLNQRGDRC